MKGTTANEWSLGKLGAELLAVGMVFPIIMSVLAPLPSDLAADSGWGPRILITDDNSNNTGFSGYPAVAFDISGNLYVVWEDGSELDGSGPDTDVFLRKWDATAQTWGQRVLVTDDNLNNTRSSQIPQIVSDSFGNIHIVWRDGSDLTGVGFGGIYWRMLDASTKSWVPPVHISYDPNDTQGSGTSPSLAADRFGNVHVAFKKGNPGPAFGIQYMKWNGTTRTWGNMATVSVNTTKFDHPEITVDPLGDVHIVWDDDSNSSGASTYGKDRDIFYRRLVASTNTWAPIVHLTDDDLTDVYGSQVGGIVADVYSNIHVVWYEAMDQAGLGYGLDVDIFYRKWNASSGVWEPRVVVSNDPGDTAGSFAPKIDMDMKGDIHFVWRDHSDVDGAGSHAGDVFYRKLDSLNGIWEDTTSLTNDLNDRLNGWFPEVASDRYGNLAVVWWDQSDLNDSVQDEDADVYMRRMEVPIQNLQAMIDCDPDTINLKSQGKWITCYIELPPGNDPRDIDASTTLLNDVLAPELNPKYGFAKSETSYIMDHDGDGVLERMVKFNRSEVKQMLSPGDSVPLTITGKLFDGTEFEGTDEVRVMDSIKSTQSLHERTPRQGRSESAVEFLIRMRTHRSIVNLI
ncbi:MAG: hypothetical protein KAR39_05825 [Thermoplasmata archaeon]|nr:hypothetical protein [Thermoplasmata archaeon]